MSFTDTGLRNPFGSPMSSGIRSVLTGLSNLFAGLNIESYIVGGLVRDTLMGRDTADIDVAVAADAMEVATGVASALGGKYVLLDSINRTSRVILFDQETASKEARWQLDFSTMRGDIIQDLAQRDFTINAIAIDLEQFKNDSPDIRLIDPFGGQDDLERRTIRVVADTAFQEDGVRLLRAARLAAELGLSIDKHTEDLIRRSSSLISSIACERIREELLKLLAIPGAGQYIAYLDELRLLTALFPELGESRDVKQPKEHFWDVFVHSLKTVNAADFLLRQGDWEYAGKGVLAAIPWSAALAENFAREVSDGSTHGSLLKLAALLHDIAKPQSKTIEADGRIRFLGHAQEGAVVAANALKRLRFSGREINLVETMVKHHLRPGQMSQQGLPTPRAVYRYFRDTGEAGIDILFLSLADHLAARGPGLNLSGWQEHASIVRHVISQHFEQADIARLPRLITGHDLLNIFKISPGPEIGKILEAVSEAQASGEITTREEALSFIDRLRKDYA